MGSPIGTEPLTVEEALDAVKITPDYDPGGQGGPRDCVHSYRSFLGAHWDMAEVEAAMREHGVHRLVGDSRHPLDHNIVVVDPTGPIYFEGG